MTKHICPTCESVLPAERELKYLASGIRTVPAEDDIHNWYEEVSRLVYFLGALAKAGPLALNAHREGIEEYTPDWLQYLAWLSDELAEETQRRLLRLRGAAILWEDRAKAAEPGKYPYTVQAKGDTPDESAQPHTARKARSI